MGFVFQNRLVPAVSTDLVLSGAQRQQSGELMLQLHEELVGCAFQLSVAASVAIGLSSGLPAVEARSLARYLPALPSIVSIFLEEMNSAATKTELTETLSQFSSELLRLRVDAVALSSIVDGAPSEFLQLSSGWRGLATELAKALSLLVEQSPNTFEAGNTAIARSAVLHLETISGGRPSCLDRSGRIIIPVVDEKRQFSRASVPKYTYVMCTGGIQRVLILDVSAQGLGVWGLRGSLKGDEIEILVAPGKQIRGVVVWCSGMRAGINFLASEQKVSATLIEMILRSSSETGPDKFHGE